MLLIVSEFPSLCSIDEKRNVMLSYFTSMNWNTTVVDNIKGKNKLLIHASFFFSEMPRCNSCVPCFMKSCGLCINCLKNSKGNRVHRKCRRTICMKDRPKAPQPKLTAAEAKYTKQLAKISRKTENALKKMKKAQTCRNPNQFVELLKQIPSFDS